MSNSDTQVINPHTGRRIRKGGTMYNKLVKKGDIEDTYDDPRVIPDELAEYEDMESINETLPPDVYAVKGVGKYKEKLVTRRKQQVKAKDTLPLSSVNTGKGKYKIKETPKLTEEEEEQLNMLYSKMFMDDSESVSESEEDEVFSGMMDDDSTSDASDEDEQ